MTFKSPLWFPAAVALTALNLGGAWFAAGAGESLHATAHAVLALGFGLWARHLRDAPRQRALQAEIDELEGDVQLLGQELNEAQERLDFAERMLAQRQDAPRVDVRRPDQ